MNQAGNPHYIGSVGGDDPQNRYGTGSGHAAAAADVDLPSLRDLATGTAS
jgi:hypothetical protein